MTLAPLAALLALAPGAKVERFTVKPSDTDPAISQFDSPHAVFIDPSAKPRNQLLLFMPGTNGKTSNTDLFCETAAEQGYQVINLMYPDDISAAVVRKSSDRNAFLNFRLEVIEGKDLSSEVQVDRANSIENRLIKALLFLDKQRPKEHWARFLTKGGDLDWPRIAVSGLSQGAGHAALLAFRHHVARALMFGGPKDFDQAVMKPAAWYVDPATPTRDMYTFNNLQDRQGCTFPEQLENCRAVGLYRLGDPVDVDSASAPYHHSHILTTNCPGTPVPSIRAHTSVVADRSTPKAKDGSPLFKPVWIYMLTN